MASLGNYKWAGRACNTAPSVWGILSQISGLGAVRIITILPHRHHTNLLRISVVPAAQR